MDRTRFGCLLSAVGGALILLVSVEISYIHSYMRVFLDFPLGYPAPFINSMANSIGYYGLICGILVVAGAFLSIRKNLQFTSGLVSLIFSGLSTIVGVLLWLPPFYIAGAIGIAGSNSPPPFHLFPLIRVEVYAPLFFLGTFLGVAGGGITVAASNVLARSGSQKHLVEKTHSYG